MISPTVIMTPPPPPWLSMADLMQQIKKRIEQPAQSAARAPQVASDPTPHHVDVRV